jgi:NAD(P)-dependent dehydrogenase (short-subunit alcohol dehydrogenase family)
MILSNTFAITAGYLPYVASKGAVEQMARVLSRDPALTGPERRITVNVVSPGPIATELFLKGKPQQLLDQISGLHPQKRLGQPEDVSAASANILIPAVLTHSPRRWPARFFFFFCLQQAGSAGRTFASMVEWFRCERGRSIK